jgi:small subunit ribosomal protein S1
LHRNHLSFLGKPEENLKSFKKGDKLEKLKLLECDVENQKIQVSLREAISTDPFKFYDKFTVGDILTCIVLSSDQKGITVRPEGSELEAFIKKSQLSTEKNSQRTSRWNVGDRVDTLLEKKENNKISLSIRALEEKLNAEALKKYGEKGLSSGKSLPFASLSDKLEKKRKETE